MDPLSPSAINPSWSNSPDDPQSTSTSNPVPPPPPLHLPIPATLAREPQIYGDPGKGLVAPPASDIPNSAATTGSVYLEEDGRPPAPFLRVRIGGLERNRKDLLLKFDASTNLPNFRTTLYRNQQRSYAEFQRFAEQLQLCCPQTIVPALPLPHASAATDEEDDRLVRIALQRWFTRVCDDPVLQGEDELRSFIESDFGYQPVPPPSARKSTSSSGAVPQVFTAALSKVVRRGPLDEDDQLATAKGALERLEERWGAAAAAVNSLSKARRGSKLIAFATVESDPALATAERKIGRVYEQLSGMAGAQSANENVVLSDSLGYQALNARSAKEALVQRIQVLEDSQNATKTAINKRRNVERLKGSSNINPMKVDEALQEMKEAEGLEDQLGRRIKAISANLHLALRTHSAHTHEDVAVSLLEHARMSIVFNRQILRELEALRPDLAKVGSQGSISTAPIVSPQSNINSTAQYSALPGTPVSQQRFGSMPGSAQIQGSPRISVAQGQGRHPEQQQQQQPSMVSSRPYNTPPQAQYPTGPSSSDVGNASVQPALTPAEASSPMSYSKTSQSMFLPSQSQGFHGDIARPHSAGPQGPPQVGGTGPGAGKNVDPLGGGQMAQSMMLPGQRAGGTVGRAQAKRLDERKAAKLLAGGF